MYTLQEKPDATAVLESGSEVRPVATLKDEHGGVSHIIVDDHCYVLVNGSDDRPFSMVAWWYREAVAALQQLPLPS